MGPRCTARSGLFAIALTTAFLGCNGIFGWSAAEVDPTLGADGGEAGTTSSNVISCDVYCNLVMTYCTGKLAAYGSPEVCRAMCNKLEPGFAGETSANTVACRQYHAAAAANDAEHHCPHASAMGGEICGSSLCEAFCLYDVALCKTTAYPSESSCRTSCAKFRYDVAGGDLGQPSGDTLNCRLYHLQNAYGINAEVHCPHTAVTSATCH